MKNFILRNGLILLILFLIGLNTYSQSSDTAENKTFISTRNFPNSKTPINNSFPLKCEVFRIKKVNDAYIIDIKGENKLYYTIISLKSEKQNFKKIKKGEQYEFLLFAYYLFILIGDPEYRRGIIYTIDNVPIIFKEDFKTGIIVTSPNLQGLYYIPPK